MAGAFPNIGYHISEIELIRGKTVGIFDFGACEVAWSLQARLAGLHGFYDQALFGPHSVKLLSTYHCLASRFTKPPLRNLEFESSSARVKSFKSKRTAYRECTRLINDQILED